jgi:hypothetical protein
MKLAGRNRSLQLHRQMSHDEQAFAIQTELWRWPGAIAGVLPAKAYR